MKMWMCSAVALGALAGSAGLAGAGEVSVARGAQVAITSGCHDCHTAAYAETGKIDPAAALVGTGLGWQGPWGTTYPANLRLIARDKGSEDAFLQYAKTFQARPPVPRERYPLALPVHRLARRTGRSCPRVCSAGTGAEDTLHRDRAADHAEGLRSRKCKTPGARPGVFLW